jgi:hypothetical protein
VPVSGPAVTPQGDVHDVRHVHHESKADESRPGNATPSRHDGLAVMTGLQRAHRLPEHGQLAEIHPASTVEQRWCNGWHSWVRRRDGGLNPELFEVHPISDPVAKSYVERMHYSGSYVAASRRFGMFIHTPDGLDLVGVAVFAIPAQARVLTNVFPDLRPYAESLELARFVLEGPRLSTSAASAGASVSAGRAPANSESWFLRECFRFLAADGIAGMVSFADPVPRIVAGRTLFVGHVGTIYQSSNAVLTGRSTRRYVTVLPDGTSLSGRASQISCGACAGTAADTHGRCLAAPAAWSARSLDDWRRHRLVLTAIGGLHPGGSRRPFSG